MRDYNSLVQGMEHRAEMVATMTLMLAILWVVTLIVVTIHEGNLGTMRSVALSLRFVLLATLLPALVIALATL